MRHAFGVSLLTAVTGLAPHADAGGQSTGGAYAIPAQVVAAGGGRTTGGSFQLEGTIGQHVVGPAATGGGFELIPGFHRHGSIAEDIFDDGFEDL